MAATVTRGDLVHSWRQLRLKPQLGDRGNDDEERGRDQLERGMPASPDVTYFRVEVTRRSTEKRIGSALFRCCLVRDSGQLGYRPWTEADQVVRSLSPTLSILAYRISRFQTRSS